MENNNWSNGLSGDNQTFIAQPINSNLTEHGGRDNGKIVRSKDCCEIVSSGHDRNYVPGFLNNELSHLYLIHLY